jgi:hypothetical protein
MKWKKQFRLMLQTLLPRRPALFHQIEQMRKGFLVSAAVLRGKLARALVQLRGHFTGFFGRTTERDKDFCQFRNFHKRAVDGNLLQLQTAK